MNNKKIPISKTRNNSIKTIKKKDANKEKLRNKKGLNYYNNYKETYNTQNKNCNSCTNIIHKPISIKKHCYLNTNNDNFRNSKFDLFCEDDEDINIDKFKPANEFKTVTKNENDYLKKSLYRIYKYKKTLNSLKAKNDYFKRRIKFLQNENLKLKNLKNNNTENEIINKIFLLLNRYNYNDINNSNFNLRNSEKGASFDILHEIFLINKEYKMNVLKNNLIQKLVDNYSKTEYSKMNDNNNLKNIYDWITILLKAYDKNSNNNLMNKQNENYEYFIKNLFDLVKVNSINELVILLNKINGL